MIESEDKARKVWRRLQLRLKRLVSAPSMLTIAVAIGAQGTARASAAEDFYKGKTISLYISSSAGNGYDIYGRLVRRFLSDPIPGKPTIVPIDMAGAEGRVAATYVYNALAKDGL